MKNFFVIITLVILLSCKSTWQSTNNDRYKEAYIKGYKIQYFRSLILKGFNESEEIKKILKKDASKGMADVQIPIVELNLIDSLTVEDNMQMVKDSISSYKRAEGAQGKYIFSFALNKYESKWLDSLAKAVYKRNK